MNEKEMLYLIRPMLTDRTPAPLSMQVFHAWTLHAALQVAIKHPAVSQSQKTIWRDTMWLLKKAIVARYPETRAAFKSGVRAEAFEILTANAMADKTPLQIELTVAKVWFLVAALQLVDRHSRVVPDTKRRLRSLGGEFQQYLEDLYPDATVILNMGWDSAYDKEGSA